MTRVKICGVRTHAAARAAIAGGADLLGFVFYRPSPRYVELELAAAIIRDCRAELGGAWEAVAVFANPTAAEVRAAVESGCFEWVQLSGDETPEFCAAVGWPVLRGLRVGSGGALAAVRSNRYGVQRYLLDTHVPGQFGGTGQRFDWTQIRPVAAECFLAGGLTPDNVGRAIREVRPWGVDVSSGVERAGQKDSALIGAFLAEVRRVDRGD